MKILGLAAFLFVCVLAAVLSHWRLSRARAPRLTAFMVYYAESLGFAYGLVLLGFYLEMAAAWLGGHVLLYALALPTMAIASSLHLFATDMTGMFAPHRLVPLMIWSLVWPPANLALVGLVWLIRRRAE